MLSCLDELFGFIKMGRRFQFNSILESANSFFVIVFNTEDSIFINLFIYFFFLVLRWYFSGFLRT